MEIAITAVKQEEENNIMFPKENRKRKCGECGEPFEPGETPIIAEWPERYDTKRFHLRCAPPIHG